ncbi:2Fe-2S iron-sulfur cluster-binding protein [Agrobacterium vitis]|uniref:2Fe-2S iron-sulfur cluster binding domain-containing protein n=1 Tax=Agrobacterium vitis TaxID=373 RepID=A0AAE2RD05_AGRVI|nr:2Fe-2S iron-sulfur cluster-binding protein [Agrobacterium vitis]MBF2714386.1 2Fe-2S iron-sulfur cluster binding domain-containing protein [Agrobacterium vitis]MUZ64338.1 2Fe-2S iron-sulfur cluster binding domain-containing protein [Agrobacterium vitis]MVA18981.1 2Fe-2S iron-sulfur cluster binding domain-containing protein [Agrobacterium vitis]
MTRITFISHNGAQSVVDAADGDSVMRVALTNDIDGITGECGGSMMCATCHCYVDDRWVETVGVRADGEEDMLESAVCAVRPSSRLSCQIRITPHLDGLVIHLPESQT